MDLRGEINRLDTKERLDALIELQKELLATQREILAELKSDNGVGQLPRPKKTFDAHLGFQSS
ncbi:hypothetical protein [Mesorhizobium sp.]|uniref:hypothetical protein n=1 Tax=Mesorhizobium sp. TaxID=1871066 RepID=UPI000FE6B832|nr:hypothetical protein [Mesorhizobium sp.]RWP65819.1 MAG: hypothetical protein EOR08_04350 [Mesorhizobium sp.]